MESPLSNNSHNSVLSMVFDPFMIGEEHAKHTQSTSIVQLEESRKIFCPLCLESVSLKEIEALSEDLYDQYIKNLFEALDQHNEKEKLRKIVVKMLEIILTRRAIIVKSETDFHNFLRIIHKTMKSDKFSNLEFSSMTIILALVLTKFAKPLPLVPIWKVLSHTLDYGIVELGKLSSDYINRFNDELCRLFSSLSSVIKTFLEMLRRLGKDKISDLIFPVYEIDTPKTIGAQYFESSQKACLRFMFDNLIPKCWKSLNESVEQLSPAEETMVRNLFDALLECHLTSSRLGENDILKSLENLDYLKLTHSLIYKNRNNQLTKHLKNFLNVLVSHCIETYFGANNEYFKMLMETPDIVETNHKNAITYSYNQQKCRRTLFYILINCVALKQSSAYFVSTRVKKVLKVANPRFLDVHRSPILTKAYMYVAAHVTSRVTSYETIIVFCKELWREMLQERKFAQFNKEFCFDETVFYWAYDQTDFIKMVRPRTIVQVIGLSQGDKVSALFRLLKNEKYKLYINIYLSKADSALNLVKEATAYDVRTSGLPQQANEETHHVEQMSQLSAVLLPLFNQSILVAINNFSPAKIEVIRRLANILVKIMTDCRHFNFMLNDQEIRDLFEFLEMIYNSPGEEKKDETLISLNKFLAQLMKTNHRSLMKVLNKLDYSVLGLMFHRLADYTKGDGVAESIAHVLVAYDHIDYPLIQDIGKNLHPMALSTLNWMLSQNNDLHILSLTLAHKVLSTRISPSTKISVSTGLIHMLTSNPELLERKMYLDMFLSVVGQNEFKYNPLIKHVLNSISSRSVKEVINAKLLVTENARPSSPVLSFISDESSFDEERQMSITQILTQLHDDGEPNIESVPNSLYISQGTCDNNLDTEDMDQWERRAFEAVQLAEPY